MYISPPPTFPPPPTGRGQADFAEMRQRCGAVRPCLSLLYPLLLFGAPGYKNRCMIH